MLFYFLNLFIMIPILFFLSWIFLFRRIHLSSLILRVLIVFAIFNICSLLFIVIVKGTRYFRFPISLFDFVSLWNTIPAIFLIIYEKALKNRINGLYGDENKIRSIRNWVFLLFILSLFSLFLYYFIASLQLNFY